MSGTTQLETYLEGWRLGEGNVSLTATAPGFFYDDPNTGRILRSGFVGFVEDFKSWVADMNAGQIGTPFLTYSDVVISDADGVCWCWWQATGTDVQGAALIRFDAEGVQSEKIGYFSRLP